MKQGPCTSSFTLALGLTILTDLVVTDTFLGVYGLGLVTFSFCSASFLSFFILALRSLLA
jgi:hypothetical protein